MKKFLFLPLLFATLCLSSCVEEDANANDDDLIPTVEQNGVLGSWSHNYEGVEDHFPSIGKEWYIRRTLVSIANICNLGSGRISAMVEVRAEIRGGTLTILENATRTISANGLNCSISVTANSVYGLNLESENVLRISNAGEALQYTRFID